MEPQKKIVFGILLLTVFVFVVALSSMYVQIQIEADNVCGCVIPLNLFIPLLASIGLFIGTLVYYFLSPRFEVPAVDKDTIMRLFDAETSKVLQVIVSNKGEIPQSRISRLSGMSKVKVFRILETLRKKGIVEKHPYGKTNLIKINSDFEKLLL